MSKGSAEVKVINPEAFNVLADLAAQVTGDVLATAIHTGLFLIEGDAKLKCPVDTGTLRRSIMVEAKATGPHDAEGRCGTNVEYGPFVEFGTRFMAPQPFLRPAADQNQDQVVAEIASTIKDIIGS